MFYGEGVAVLRQSGTSRLVIAATRWRLRFTQISKAFRPCSSMSAADETLLDDSTRFAERAQSAGCASRPKDLASGPTCLATVSPPRA